ncbi:MAG: hypothetical protein BWX92_03491 [Deltaproteobacteria bacterium ADurb.Bin135]|nr:MAG: hypothetical protein BWX92_03491 [Deltaproteobacteria bacterium ADurb.Bin135]
MSRVKKLFIIMVVNKIEFKSIRISATGNCFPNNLSCLHHLEGNKAVEMSKGYFFNQFINGIFILKVCFCLFAQKVFKLLSCFRFVSVLEFRKGLYIFKCAVGMKSIDTFKLFTGFLHKDTPYCLHHLFYTVTGLFIHIPCLFSKFLPDNFPLGFCLTYP